MSKDDVCRYADCPELEAPLPFPSVEVVRAMSCLGSGLPASGRRARLQDPDVPAVIRQAHRLQFDNLKETALRV